VVDVPATTREDADDSFTPTAPRMTRKPKTFGWPTIVSLILLAATVVFWHRGNRQRECISYRKSTGGSWAQLCTVDGKLVLTVQRDSSPVLISWWNVGPNRAPTFRPEPGFSATVDDHDTIDAWTSSLNNSVPGRSVQRGAFMIWTGPGFMIASIPMWLVLALAAILPLTNLLSLLRRRRRKVLGLCPNCGYDLRHSPERCPECGEPVSSPEESSDPVENPPKNPAAVASSR
jgi:hypothetical protein